MLSTLHARNLFFRQRVDHFNNLIFMFMFQRQSVNTIFKQILLSTCLEAKKYRWHFNCPRKVSGQLWYPWKKSVNTRVQYNKHILYVENLLAMRRFTNLSHILHPFSNIFVKCNHNNNAKSQEFYFSSWRLNKNFNHPSEQFNPCPG